MQLTPVLLVAAGGALGAVCRYLSTSFVAARLGSNFPYGTLTVNVLGSFLIGLITAMACHNADPHLMLLLVTGFLGGFTTFSTFSLDAVSLYGSADYLRMFLYIAGSVLAGIGAAVAGMALGNLLRGN